MPFMLAVDYDDTLFEGPYPKKGKPKWDIVNKVKQFIQCGAEVVLWTCREGSSLAEAVKRCKDELGLEFVGINENAPTAKKWISDEKRKSGDVFAATKIYADFYLDDKSNNLDIFLAIDVEKTCRSFVEAPHK